MITYSFRIMEANEHLLLLPGQFFMKIFLQRYCKVFLKKYFEYVVNFN